MSELNARGEGTLESWSNFNTPTDLLFDFGFNFLIHLFPNNERMGDYFH